MACGCYSLLKVEVTREWGVESCFQNFFIPKNLNKLSQVFGLGLWKRFMLEKEVIVFTITLLGNKRLSTQNNTQVIRIAKNEITCLRPVLNKLVEIL